MSLSGEPDDGVSGNMDLSRLFALLVRGQENTARIMGDMRDATTRSLHMAQSFMTGNGPTNAFRARQAMNNTGNHNPQAGQTTAQTLQAQQGANGVFTVNSTGQVTPPGPQVPQGPTGGQQQPRRPMWSLPPIGSTTTALLANNTMLPQNAASFGATFSQMASATAQQSQRNWSRSAFGVWSPYWNPQGGTGAPTMPQQGGPPGGGYHLPPGGGGQLGSGPYGMGPQGLPPSPIYFGGQGTPYGAYGAYGPYGPSGGGPGGGGGGGSLGAGANRISADGGHLWGMNSGVGGWIRRNVPGVGLVDKAFGEVKSQRNKNEYYQNINGGSNFDGFAERFHEEAYVASTSAMFNDEEARAAFKGVTRLGYNGKTKDQFDRQGGRQDALNFIYHGKTSYGASINESLQQLEVVSKNSTLSIRGLQAALKDVSDTAGKAGVNAQMARKQMMSLVQEGVQAGYGAGSISTAQNMQMGKTSLGRSYQDIDLSGQMGQQYTYMASSNMGMTYNQYTAMQTTNPLAAAQGRAGQNLSLLSQIFTQEEVNWIKQKADSLGGSLDSDSALSIVPDFLQAFPNHNISVIQQQLAAFGIVQTDDPQKAVAYAFNLIAGNNGDLANAQKTAKDNKVMSKADAAKADDSGKGFIKDFDTGVHRQGFLNWVTEGSIAKGEGWGDKEDASSMKEYKAGVKSSGQRNPVIENILKTLDKEDDAKVIIHTSGGQRVVSLQEAIKNHAKELSSGQARFVAGEAKGKSVQDLLGAGAIDAQSNWMDEAAKSSSVEGTSLADWEKKNPKDKQGYNSGSGTGANGKVVVELSDEAKQLLRISSATGIAGANGEGAPPLNSYNWNANR